MCCWVPVYFLLLAARTLLLNVKAGVERAALHPCAAAECVLPAAGWRGKALVLQSVVRIGGVGLRELRRLWVRLPLRSCVLPLLTAAVSGQQAPAPTTAMPAVQRIAEVIVQSPISPKDSRGNCSKSKESKG